MRQYKNTTLKVKKPRDSSPLKSLNNHKTPSNSKRRRDPSKPHSSSKKGSPDHQRNKSEDENTTINNTPDATNLNLRKSVDKNKKH